MATVKGLAYALGKPMATCTTFEAIASGYCGVARPLVVLFPAPKERVLVAVYESENGMMHPTLAPQICALDNVTMLFPYGALVTGPGAERHRNRLEKEYGGSFQLTFESDSFVRGVAVARLGLKRLQAGEVADLARLEPQYFFAWGSGDVGNA
jgi:tRNA A37 threonylcarbamoyladenosine modification protein TsaB